MEEDRDKAFSILGRIGGDATTRYGPRRQCRYWLSVSSVGSEAMQHSSEGCPPDSILRLSVSSVGSEAMQLIQDMDADDGETRPFSILGRIGGDATVRASGYIISRDYFQYPRSDRRRCNLFFEVYSNNDQYLSVSSVGSEAMQLRLWMDPN